MSKDEQLYKDIGDIKECLLGDPYKPGTGVVHNLHEVKQQQSKFQDQQLVMQNQLHTLLEEREKNKNKISFKIPGWMTTVFGLAVKAKTGM